MTMDCPLCRGSFQLGLPDVRVLLFCHNGREEFEEQWLWFELSRLEWMEKEGVAITKKDVDRHRVAQDIRDGRRC